MNTLNSLKRKLWKKIQKHVMFKYVTTKLHLKKIEKKTQSCSHHCMKVYDYVMMRSNRNFSSHEENWNKVEKQRDLIAPLALSFIMIKWCEMTEVSAESKESQVWFDLILKKKKKKLEKRNGKERILIASPTLSFILSWCETIEVSALLFF